MKKKRVRIRKHKRRLKSGNATIVKQHIRKLNRPIYVDDWSEFSLDPKVQKTEYVEEPLVIEFKNPYVKSLYDNLTHSNKINLAYFIENSPLLPWESWESITAMKNSRGEDILTLYINDRNFIKSLPNTWEYCKGEDSTSFFITKNINEYFRSQLFVFKKEFLVPEISPYIDFNSLEEDLNISNPKELLEFEHPLFKEGDLMTLILGTYFDRELFLNELGMDIGNGYYILPVLI